MDGMRALFTGMAAWEPNVNGVGSSGATRTSIGLNLKEEGEQDVEQS